MQLSTFLIVKVGGWMSDKFFPCVSQHLAHLVIDVGDHSLRVYGAQPDPHRLHQCTKTLYALPELLLHLLALADVL